MPIPKPNSGEDRDKFINRCMKNEVMKREFPDNTQRVAVCTSQLKKKNGGKK